MVWFRYGEHRILAGHRFGGCLADDMGLGKTIQTIAVLLASGSEPRPDNLWHHAQHRLVLTGTPIENSLTDLWS